MRAMLILASTKKSRRTQQASTYGEFEDSDECYGDRDMQWRTKCQAYTSKCINE